MLPLSDLSDKICKVWEIVCCPYRIVCYRCPNKKLNKEIDTNWCVKSFATLKIYHIYNNTSFCSFTCLKVGIAIFVTNPCNFHTYTTLHCNFRH